MIGKFHPLLVHLPIGFFFLAALLRVLIVLKKISVSASFFQWVLLSTLLVSVLSMGTGWLLSGSGEYDAALLGRHQWSAVLFSILLLLLYFTRNLKRVHDIFWGLALLVLTLTGHYGGSLTHGEDFLWAAEAEPLIIENVQEARVYEELIRPVLEKKCYSCHGRGKQKGELRLDSPEFLLKGGEEGPALEAFHPGKSLLMRRIMLPESDEDHMPPKGKPQVTAAEQQLLEWWISQGADFHKKSSELEQSLPVRAMLEGFQRSARKEESKAVLPEKEVKPASASDLEVLKAAGILVNPAGQNTNYLEANLMGVAPSGTVLKALENLSDQLIRLNAAGVQNAEQWGPACGKLKNLRVLHLQRSSWSDAEMMHLKALSHLQVLNLSFTGVTEKGLKELKELKELRKLYLYGSGVKDGNEMIRALPGVVIDTGGYRLSILPDDSLRGDF